MGRVTQTLFLSVFLTTLTGPVTAPAAGINACQWRGSYYFQHQSIFRDNCRHCVCQSGTISCRNPVPELKECGCQPCRTDTGLYPDTTLAPEGTSCEWEGTYYEHGQVFYDSCHLCRCKSGTMECSMPLCYPSPPPCVNPVFNPVSCGCPFACPDGRNCRLPNGTLIKGMWDVAIDDYTICRCIDDSSNSFLGSRTIAQCRPRAGGLH